MKRPFISPASPAPPLIFLISSGSTGAVMPMATVSMVTATKMKARAALRPRTGAAAAAAAAGAAASVADMGGASWAMRSFGREGSRGTESRANGPE